MATGPEHFKEAEGRLKASDFQRQGDHEDALMCAIHEALVAGVHAALALAAATALARFDQLPAPDCDAWLNTAATKDPAR